MLTRSVSVEIPACVGVQHGKSPVIAELELSVALVTVTPCGEQLDVTIPQLCRLLPGTVNAFRNGRHI